MVKSLVDAFNGNSFHERENATMSRVEESVDLNVSADQAYKKWRRFEDFPLFMEGVESVTQVGEDELQWKAEVGGKTEQWTARITEDVPGKRIAWAADDGADNAGVVTFHHLDASKCRLMLQMEYDPEGVVENVGDAVGVITHRVKGDLKNFKEMVETGG